MSTTTKIDTDLGELCEALTAVPVAIWADMMGHHERSYVIAEYVRWLPRLGNLKPGAPITNILAAALLGYRSRDAEIESIHEGYKEQIKSLVASAERSQGLAADLRYHLQNRPADLAAKDAEIQQLKTELIMAMDAASKGDLARQTAGGMEMELAAKDAEIAELVEALKSGIKWLDRLDQRRDLIHASFFGGADYDPASSVKEIRTLLIKHGKENL